MHVTHLSLHDFRSYAELELDLEPGASAFIGANGQGKTNLVEAIDYLATLGSHRVASDAPLVRIGAERAVVRANVVRDDRSALLEIEITPGRSNRARVNRGPLPRPRDLLGWLRSVGPKAQVLHRFSWVRGKHELDAWIRHLAMLAAGVRRETFILSKGRFDEPVMHRFSKVARPKERLADLVALHRLGQRVPLPLFPDPASKYAAKLREGKTPEQALAAAMRTYKDGFDGSKNDYVVKVYGERDPLAPSFRLFDGHDDGSRAAAGDASPPSFADLAERVFGPLLQHLEQVDLVKEAS